jgi:hypothetical protein
MRHSTSWWKCALSLSILYFAGGVSNFRGSTGHAVARVRPSVTDWNNYRISDGISRGYGAVGCEHFPDSIVCSYENETSKANDIPALLRVLSKPQWHRAELPIGTVVVHVRLGDGLCAQQDKSCRGDREGIPDCWNYDEDCFRNPYSETKQYAYSKKWYIPVLNSLVLLPEEVRRIIIIGDKRHWTRTPDPRNGNFSVDEAYLKNIENFWRTAFREVTTQVGKSPDEDFITMCSARIFVSGGGGYSALVAKIVRARGGTVFRPTNKTEF